MNHISVLIRKRCCFLLPIVKNRLLFLIFLGYFLPMKSRAQCTITISTFPYMEDFEAGNGNWLSGGTADDWAWGSPAKPVISGAGSGTKCWISGGLTTSFYNAGERSYVKSPCFDFSGMVNPYFSGKIFWETEKQYDGANLQYSTDGGNTWSNVGALNDVTNCLNTNWYNYTPITNLANLTNVKEGWSGNIQSTSGSCQGGSGSNGWVTVKHTMPYLGGKPQVMFRFTFGSGTTCNNYDGFAFDSIAISEAPTLPSIAYQVTQAGCTQSNGSATTIVNGGTAPFNYSWFPNVSSGSQANNIPAGTYTVGVTDAYGCFVSLQFDVPSSPPPLLSVSSTPDTCGLGKGTAFASASSGTAPYQYLWSNAETNDKITLLNSNTYMVTVTDDAGCSLTQDVIISDTGYFTINLGPDFIICGKSNTLLTPGIFENYLWQDGSNLPFYEVINPGLISVTVEDSHGCKSADTVLVTENCLQDILVPSAFTPNDDGFNDVFFAYGINVESFNFKIINRWGQTVFESSNINLGWNGKFKGQQAGDGLYAWKLIFRITGTDTSEKNGTVLLIR